MSKRRSSARQEFIELANKVGDAETSMLASSSAMPYPCCQFCSYDGTEKIDVCGACAQGHAGVYYLGRLKHARRLMTELLDVIPTRATQDKIRAWLAGSD